MNEKMWDELMDDMPGRAELREIRDMCPTTPGVYANVTGMSVPKTLESGTTLLAMKYAGGVLCAADTQTSAGNEVISRESKKIYPTSDLSAVLGCGAVSSIQLIVKWLCATNRAFETDSSGYMLSIKGQARYLATVNRLLFRAMWPFFSVNFILAGLEKMGVGRIYSVYGDGAIIEHSNFATDGSGGPSVRPNLERGWRPDMSLEGAVKLAVESIILAGIIDTFTADGRVALPHIADINPDQGFRFLDEKLVRGVVVECLKRNGLGGSILQRLLVATEKASTEPVPDVQSAEQTVDPATGKKE